MLRARAALVTFACLAIAACGGDADDYVGDPGGMGAGRPDTAGSAEVPATDVLRGPGYGPADTTRTLDQGSDLTGDTVR